MRVEKIAIILSCAASVGTLGCAGHRLIPQTPLKSAPAMSRATLIVSEITRPRDLVYAAGNPFFAAMQRDMMLQLQKSGIAKLVVSERDLGSTGVPQPAYHIRLRVVEDTVLVTNTGSVCATVLLTTGVLTIVPLFFVGLCTSTAEHRMTVEARVFNVDSAQIQRVQDATSNEMVNVYDTSSLTPLLRKEYQVKIEAVRQALGGKLEPEEELAFQRQESEEAVRQLLAASVDDTAAVLR